MSAKISSLPAVVAANIVDTDVFPLVATNITSKVSVAQLRIKLGTNPPAGGRTVTDTFTYLTNNARFNPLDFGAFGDGVTDDSAAIQLAITKATAVDGMVDMPAGRTFRTLSTITITCHFSAYGAIISYLGSGIAVQIGDGTNLLADKRIFLPKVRQAAKTAIGWGVQSGFNIATSIGVKTVATYEIELHVPHVQDFGIGFQEYGTAIGNAYNRVFFGHLFNNKINHQMTGDVATGWANENVHFGGRMSHNSGELVGPNTPATGQPGTRQIQILPLNSIINNNRWYSVSIEGDVPEFMIDCAGATNLFEQCRYEAGQIGGGAFPKCQVTGANSTDNFFNGGISLDAVTFTFAGGATAGATKIVHKGGVRWAPGSVVGPYALGNSFSSTNPIITLLDAGVNPNNFGTTWNVQMGSRTLLGKATGDAAGSPRVTHDFTTGDITSLGTIKDKNTTRGSTVCATGVFTTIATPAAAGRYTVSWTLPAFGGGSNFTGIADLVHDGAGNAYLIDQANGVSSACQMSGGNFQIKQSSAGSATMNWVIVYTPF